MGISPFIQDSTLWSGNDTLSMVFVRRYFTGRLFFSDSMRVNKRCYTWRASVTQGHMFGRFCNSIVFR